MSHLTGHVVICNWNHQAQRMIESIHAELLEKSEEEWTTVVVVAENVQSFPDNDRFEDTLLLPGSPMLPSLLRRANVQDAHTVIIVADRTLDSPDDQTLQIALIIRSIQRSNGRKCGGELRIVAEVLDATRAPNFRRHEITGIHEVVCESDLSVRVLAQTNISPGLTYLLGDILEYDANENDIYMVTVPERWRFAGQAVSRFSDLVAYVGERSFDGDRQRPALLLGLRRTHQGNRDEMLINPTAGRLAAFGPIEPGDALVLLARDPAHARMAIAPDSTPTGLHAARATA